MIRSRLVHIFFLKLTTNARILWFGSLCLLSACAIFQDELPFSQRLRAIDVGHNATWAKAPVPGTDIKVVSLNLAHGRKDSFNQMFVSEEDIRSNLDDIASFLREESAHVVALQEADDVSWWSGEFNHVQYLAQKAGYPWYVQANHVENTWAEYGTAILSRLPVLESKGLNFSPTPPTTTKGFTMVRVGLPAQLDHPRKSLDVISVHLDFSRESKREAQIDEIAEFVEGRSHQTVIMGDLNSEWLGEEQVVEALTQDGQFKLFQPESEELNTYSDKRLDWILIPTEFRFTSYRVSDLLLSDHKAVIAEISPR